MRRAGSAGKVCSGYVIGCRVGPWEGIQVRNQVQFCTLHVEENSWHTQMTLCRSVEYLEVAMTRVSNRPGVH